MANRLVRVAQAFLMLVTSAIVAEAAQQHVPLTDQQIKAQVEHRLLDHDIRGVVVAVRDGTVTLSGTVRSLWAKEEAIDEAQEVNDVKEVVSTLIVMRGESDQVVGEAVAAKLRWYVFFTIYNDPLFWNYAIQVNPPIHIVVKHGRVTLSGVVMSEEERRRRASAACLAHPTSCVRRATARWRRSIGPAGDHVRPRRGSRLGGWAHWRPGEGVHRRTADCPSD